MTPQQATIRLGFKKAGKLDGFPAFHYKLVATAQAPSGRAPATSSCIPKRQTPDPQANLTEPGFAGSLFLGLVSRCSRIRGRFHSIERPNHPPTRNRFYLGKV
jgi:hypothetical protein